MTKPFPSDELPSGYRWATEQETDDWERGALRDDDAVLLVATEDPEYAAHGRLAVPSLDHGHRCDFRPMSEFDGRITPNISRLVCTLCGITMID